MHTLVLMGTSADRSGGDVAIPVAAGETTVSGNGAPGTATQWYPKFNGSIVQAFCNSETAAALDIRFRDTNDANFNHLATTHLQTDPLRSQVINFLNYVVNTGMAIEAQGTNGGAVLDVLGLYMTNDGKPAVYVQPPTPIPSNAILVEATGAATLVADTVTEGVITFVDWTPRRDQRYKIIGMEMHGATACASRLNYLEGPYEKMYPGVIASDTSTLFESQMFYGDFGEFVGQTPPNHQTIGVAGDTAQLFRFLIVPISGGPFGGGQ